MDEPGSRVGACEQRLSGLWPACLDGYSGFPYPGEPCLRNRLVAACFPLRELERRLRHVRGLLDIAAGFQRVEAWIGEEEL